MHDKKSATCDQARLSERGSLSGGNSPSFMCGSVNSMTPVPHKPVQSLGTVSVTQGLTGNYFALYGYEVTHY